MDIEVNKISLTKGDTTIELEPHEVVSFILTIVIPMMPKDVYEWFMLEACEAHPDSKEVAEKYVKNFMKKFN